MKLPFTVVLLFASLASADAVWLTQIGPNKILVIKEVRTATGLGLKEAKDLVEAAPRQVKTGLARADADALVAKLVAAGATAEVRPEGVGAPTGRPGGTAAPMGGAGVPAEGTYSVKLESFGTNKIMCIKVVRDATGLGLADTKKLVESAPVVVKAGLSLDAAAKLSAELVKAGGTANVLEIARSP